MEELVKTQPSIAKWQYMIGYQWHEQERWVQAIEWYDRALKLKHDYIVALYRKGYAHQQLHQVGEALRAYNQCRLLWRNLAEGPQKQKDKPHAAKAAYHQAEVILENPRSIHEGGDAAITLLREAIEIDPHDHNKYYLLGKALLEARQLDAALGAFEQANQLKQDVDYILDKWAKTLMLLGRLPEAELLYERISPGLRKAYIWQDLGRVLHGKGDYDRAISAFKQAIQKDSRNHNNHYYLGVCHRDMSNWGQAALEFREAIRLKKKHYHGDFPEAQLALTSLLSEHPDAEQQALAGHHRGIVTKYFDDKGFGFIANGTGEQVFFHIRDVQQGMTIERGVNVEFEMTIGDRGPKAIQVHPTNL